MFSDSDSGTVLNFPGSPGRRPPRERILEAMLLASGELGYEQVAVRHVIERAQTSRATFYKHFEGREDCFAQAYDDAGEWLYRRLLGAAGLRALDHVADGDLFVAELTAGEQHRGEDPLAGGKATMGAREAEDSAAVAIRKHAPFV